MQQVIGRLMVELHIALQANGFQLEMCIRAWHISLAHTPHQYVTQADTADMALLQDFERKVERQGMILLYLYIYPSHTYYKFAISMKSAVQHKMVTCCKLFCLAGRHKLMLSTFLASATQATHLA